MIRRVCTFLIVFFAIGLTGGYAQTKWTTLTSHSGELVIAVPSGFDVFKREGSGDVYVFGGVDGNYFDLAFTRSKAGIDEEQIERAGKRFSSLKKEEQVYKVGRADVHRIKYASDRGNWHLVTIATGKGYYRFMTSSKVLDSDLQRMILGSLRIDGAPVFPDLNGPVEVAEAAEKVSRLKSSEIVNQALKRKQRQDIPVLTGTAGAVKTRPSEPYSRPFRVVRKPLAGYTKGARDKGVSGSVVLGIELKGNGDIGSITVRQGLPNGLTEVAIKAASEIRFIPAQILGESVDVETTVVYTFVIY